MSRSTLSFVVDVDYPDHDLPSGYDTSSLLSDLVDELRDVIKWSGPTLDCHVSMHPVVSGPTK